MDVVWELQRLVDGLAERSRRSVAVDDPRLRLLAYSAHHTSVDSARKQSILQRRVPDELVKYVHRHVPKGSDEPFLLPLRPDLGLTIERLCVPIRHRSTLLGFLWVLLTEPPDDRLLERVRDAALEAGDVLFRESFIEQIAHSRERELVRDLFSHDRPVREFAASELIDNDLFAGGAATVLVAAGPTADVFQDDRRVAMELALQRTRREFPARHCLHLVRPDHGLLVVVPSGTSWPSRRLPEVGAILRRHYLAELGEDERVWVGIGAPQAALADLDNSYDQALRAVDVARFVRTLGAVVRTEDCGVYGLLAEIPRDRLRKVGLHPGLQSLLAQDDPQIRTIIATVESYLDNAGEVKATAELLNIHRASLYLRLRRFEELAGIDLRNGDDRLVVHLGLRLARLTGRR
ncbi:PucR family transcriptional regulator [Actinomadura terrae]|uniref:PucR family transcriptional regulator n=1 Tax=Actinomadura terrae TaxID=604353 RepID=UPI001FA6D9B9|nr:helix-turn-helix domain-containing protein [Actinomadura terrae]